MILGTGIMLILLTITFAIVQTFIIRNNGWDAQMAADSIADGTAVYTVSYTHLNAIDNEDGNMGNYYDRVFKIEDGKWVQIGDGAYGDESDDPVETDEYGNDTINFKYTWNGKDVSEEEYSSNLGKVFNICLLYTSLCEFLILHFEEDVHKI